MAFDNLSEKLQNVFKQLRSKGSLTEADVRAALKEVKMALLEADVNFKVVRQFTKTVQEKAIGQDVMNGLNPGQMVIKIVHDELVSLMGNDKAELPLKPGNEITVYMMIGLQGAGKTTTAAKLAGKLKAKGRKPLLAACDVYRPAAVKQLEVNGAKVGVDVFSMGDRKNPVDIAKAAVEHAKASGYNVVLLDTAGRLQIDEQMMDELVAIRQAVTVDASVLVVDAMTGQEAVHVAQTFQEKVGIDGVILTKLDGDTRGGAALSIKAICGKPIFYVGMGEKLEDLEQFYPDRMANRILGMGDVLSLIEKAQANIDEEKARDLEKRVRKAQFTFDDYLDSMEQMRKMGGIGSILSMMPGMTGGKAQELESMVDEKDLARKEAIVHSMTKAERANPDLLNLSRKQRIAKGAGVNIAEVNRFVKQFDQTRKMMKQMPGMMKGRGKRRGGFGGFNLPF
ncbi:signal recognition particle protein [Bilifractor porci]|uniref:Signal recognition particle protein n=1 Tax=Bilifractor porci TaxID=2606636 RepID=A0A7X2TNK2_9FIRM|nr:signal recognition particle protein [Bilifractor porci]